MLPRREPTFAFSAPAMNSPLFSPLAAANNTVSLATGSSGCGNVAPAPGDNVAVFLTSSAISTNLITEPAESEALIEAILADPSAEASIEGDELIGSQLTALPVSGSPAAPTFANASAVTMTWIAELAELSAGWAANLNPTDDARRRLLGQARTVDQLQSQVNAFAASRGLDITTYQVEARFGLYGALPIIVAAYNGSPDSGFVLIDGVNGSLEGPFAKRTVIQPSALLALHQDAFVSGTSISVVNATSGCGGSVAAGWNPSPPAWWECPGCGPWPAPTWTWPGYRCTFNNPAVSSACTCRRDGTSTDPAGRVIPAREICEGSCTMVPGPGFIPPAPGGGPTFPPPAPGTPPPTFACRTEYWY
jgi:hypothetical protein